MFFYYGEFSPYPHLARSGPEARGARPAGPERTEKEETGRKRKENNGKESKKIERGKK